MQKTVIFRRGCRNTQPSSLLDLTMGPAWGNASSLPQERASPLSRSLAPPWNHEGRILRGGPTRGTVQRAANAASPGGGEAGLGDGAAAAFQKRTREALAAKLKAEGISVPPAKLFPGAKIRGLCYKCKGGTSTESSLSLLVHEGGESAFFKCFRASCGLEGSVWASGLVRMTNRSKVRDRPHMERVGEHLPQL